MPLAAGLARRNWTLSLPTVFTAEAEMNTIPMKVLLDVLFALQAANARLLDANAPDPYMAVTRSMIDLAIAIEHMDAVEVET